MAFTVYARYFNALEDDYIEVYETFSDREEAEEWVAIQLDSHDCVDAYINIIEE